MQAAQWIIALKDAEHRPMFESSFPAWVSRVAFWNVSDLDQAHADDALPAIEAKVLALLDALGECR